MTTPLKHGPPPPAQSGLILAVGFVVLFVGGGSRFALGLLLKPMADDLVWGRATVSLVGTVFMIVSALGQPVVGRLVDRASPLWIVGTGLFIGGLGLALMGTVTSVWQALLVYGVIYALGYAATSLTPVGVMVLRSYGARRGLATSVAVSGMATGQLVMMGLLAALLTYLGWRQAYGLLGAINILVLVALIMTFRLISPPSMTASDPSPSASPGTREHGLGMFSQPTLRLLLVVYAICGFQDFFVSTHVVALATDHGMNAVIAGNLLAVMGLMGLIGVLAAGALSDTSGPVLPTALCFLLRIGLFGYMLFMRDSTSIMIFALLYGVTFLVTAPLTVVFAEQAVGRQHMGWVTGILIMVHQIAGGAGAFLGGSAFDRWGSYHRVFIVMFGLAIAALWTTWRLNPTSSPRTGDRAISGSQS
jgi:predicted MFS family arabinose efflux permease